MLDRLATLLAARARLVLVAGFLLVALAGAVGGPVAGLLTDDGDFDDAASEAVVADAALERAAGASPAPDFVALVRFADRRQGEERIAAAKRVLRTDRRVAAVRAPSLAAKRDPRIASDGRSAYLVAFFRAGAPGGETASALAERLEDLPGVTAGGPELAREQVGEQVAEDLARAELLAFPILFLLSLWVFRGLVAALLPLATGMATILMTFALIRFVNAEVTGMSVFALNLVIGLGLGLAIDYSLFIVSRFREELAARGQDTTQALRATLRTAGRTVVFSSATVAAALASLVVFPQRFLSSMGIGGALVALVAAVVSLTLLPALLAVLGYRVDALSPERWRRSLVREAGRERSGAWYRLSTLVMRRAPFVAAVAATLLVALGLPFTRVEFTGVDASVLPEQRSARVVDDALETKVRQDGDATSPVLIAARTADDEGVAAFARRVERTEGVTAVSVSAPANGVTRIDAVVAGPALGDRAKEAVAAIRAMDAPFDRSVGGQTAAFVDQQASLRAHLPAAVAILTLTTLVILFGMTGSVVLPLKALVMNLLGLSAAFGLLVLVFQDGRLEGLLDFSSQGALESTQPILLFAIAFGLSTDYGVFLLSRIKEARDLGASDTEAVALGLERTGRIVTAAALLFVVAIGAFATSEIIFIKQVGVGTALAVIIDATIIRALLVPALMRLLGRRNWWAPKPLARIYARFGLREEASAA